MTTIKSYTDLSQSKKLAEILPLESADMCYLSEESLIPKVIYNGMAFFNSKEERPTNIIYCWSLAALLGVLPEKVINDYYAPNLQKENGEYSIAYSDVELLYIADNPVDACVAMIEKLNELNLL